MDINYWGNHYSPCGELLQMILKEQIIPINLKKSHTLIGQICYICGKPFDHIKPICLVPFTPEAADDTRKAAKTGNISNAVALPVHYDCF